jgi:hypothetical protein
MIPAHCLLAASSQAHIKTLDNLRLGLRPTRSAITLRGQPAENRLVVTKHQQMSILGMAKVIMNPLLFTQPLDEVQVAFGVLHAERSRWINHGTQFKHVGVSQDVFRHVSSWYFQV